MRSKGRLNCDKCGQRIDWIHDVEVPQFEEVTDCKRVKVGMIKRIVSGGVE